jgi:glycosyltransferase involved in cell wall biosynthesis
MGKKRILYIEANTDGTIGGSYYSLLYLIQGLDKEIYEPIVLFCVDNILVPEYQKAAKEVYINNYNPSVSIKEYSIYYYFKLVPRFIRDVLIKQKLLRKIINEINPDLIHLNNGYDTNHEWVLAGIINRIKVVAHDRGSRPPFSMQTRIFVRLLEAIISVSDDYLNNLNNGNLTPKRKYRVYNGLDSASVRSLDIESTKSELRRSLGIQDNETLIGIVGNIFKWKGQHIFAMAVMNLINKSMPVKGIIVGGTPKGSEEDEKYLRELIGVNGMSDKIYLTGFRKDVPKILNAIDIFVHASIEPEPFGRVILEAMAFEKPIIATDIGGPREIIENGKSGILIPPNDVQSMSEAIEGLLLDQEKAKMLGKNAMLRLEEYYSVKNMVDGVEKIYSEIFLSDTGN